MKQMNMKQFNQMTLKLSKDESPASKYRRWMIENGKSFFKVDEERSKKMAIDLKAKIKQCHTNCTRAILSYKYSDLKYYEGDVLTMGIPIYHSFLIDENNIVIDPTFGISSKIRIHEAKKRGVDLKDDEKKFGVEYFGIEIPRHDMYKIICDKRSQYMDMAFLYWEMKFK